MSSLLQTCCGNKGSARSSAHWKFLLVALLAALSAISSALAQPVNDLFANADTTTVVGPMGSIFDSNVGATHETNEPVHYVGSPLSRRSVWYVWTAPQDGVVTFDTIGSSFDTILAAYRQNGTNGIATLAQLASDDDSAAGAPDFWSLMRFPVRAGTNYYIVVDGYFAPASFFPDSGLFQLNWTMDTNPVITIPPDTIQFLRTNYTVAESGIFATITVGYGGDGGLGGGLDVSVDFSTSDGTAVDGVNYLGTNGTLVFMPGETIKTFDVPIIDNTNLNNDLTVLLHLSNPSDNVLLGFPSESVLTITEDLIEQQTFSRSGAFGFTAQQYVGTEYETLAGPFGPPAASIAGDPRSARGVLVTVTRSAPAEGRVLVDFSTVPPANSNLLAAKELIDYTPATGTLVFDDYQMSATILIPVFSDGLTNTIPNLPSDKFFDVVLSNPRPDPAEATNAPNKIVPYLGPLPRTTVRIMDIFSAQNSFSFERAYWRVDEHSATNVGQYTRTITVDVVLPGGGPGSVGVRVLAPNNRYGFALTPAADYSDGDDSSDAYRSFPNTPYTDGTLPFTNPADFAYRNVVLTFPDRQPGLRRQSVTFTVTNDNFVEFNEDIRIELYPIPGDGHGIRNGEATITILFDDQPAGAADREWDPEGISRTQPPFNNTPGANNTVAGIAIQPDNRTILVGDFTAVNSVSRNRIARMNQDGSIDLSFNPGTGADGHVQSVLVYTNALNPANNGKILVSGDFTSINNIQRRGLARLNPNGSLDTTFNVGTGADGPVRSLTIQSDGKVLVTGDFQHFNDLEVNGIMRLNEDGSLDGTFNPGLGANGTIWAVAVRDTAANIFAPRTAAGTELEDINEIDTGANEGTITIDYDFLSIPDNIRIYYDGARLLDFTTNLAGQITIPYGPGASTVVTIIMNEGIGIPGTIWTYRAFVTPKVDTRTIYVAGEFTSFDGQVRNGVARLLDDGSVDPAFDPGVGVDGPVYAIAVQANNRLLIGGAFSSVQFSPRSNIARLLRDGNLDKSYHVGAGFDGPVYTITMQADGKPYIGGRFTSYNYTRRIGLARLSQNGPLDTSFLDTGYNQFAGVIRTYSFEPPRYINAIGLQPDGNVMIGGSFSQLGGNFSEDHSLVTAILTGQYSLVEGGTGVAPFTRADKSTRYNIARLIGGYTIGPGNLEFDPNAQPFTIDENALTFSATVRRVDGRLGGPILPEVFSNVTAQVGQDYQPLGFGASFLGFYAGTPLSVGYVGLSYMTIPILDDANREGDEVFALFARGLSNSLALGGELIPLGSAAAYNDSVLVTIADNDFDHGEFNFTTINYVTNENAGTARISVIRTNGTSGAVSVDVLVLPGTATPGQDYVGVNGPLTLNFSAGQTSNSFTVTLLDNPNVEPDETVRLVLTNATGGATLPGGSPTNVAVATLTIIDNDFAFGHLNFATANFVTNENAAFANVIVTRTGGALGAMTVQYETADGTAIAPADYGSVSGTLSWNSGEGSAKSFLVPLARDGIVEGDESFTIRLFNPSVAGALGSQSTGLVTIVDADAYGVLSFSQPYYESEENGGSPIITVVRRGGNSGTVSVSFATSAGTATNGFDYNDTNGVLTFLPGEVSKSFRVPLLNDTDADGDKTVNLSLSAPVNATLGLSSAVLNLIDDESINLAAGSLDTTFSTDASVNGTVYALQLQTNGSIIMAGDFTQVKFTPRNRLARLNPDGTLDNSFDIGPGADDSIRALALQSDGRILVGGVFTQINSTNRNRIARLSTDGKVDIAFDPGAGMDNPVFALLVQPDDKVLAGGSFSSFNGGTSPGLVRMNTNGTLDTSFSVGAGFDGAVYALGLQEDGKVIVGGEFVSFNGVAKTNLVRLNPDGTLDPSFNPGLSIDAPVRAILIEPGGEIVIGGSFTNIDGVTRRYLARLNVNGTLDPSFLPAGPVSGADNTVYAIRQQVDGKLMVAGDFHTFNGVTRNGLTRLNEDGTTDPTINFGNGANGFVASLAIQPDRRILLGGAFTEYDGQPRMGIARIYGGSISGSGSIEFGRPLYLVSESGTNAVISVTRRGGTTGTVSARYSTLDDTAFANIDYLSVSDVLEFPEGETRRSFTVPIIPNDTAQGDRAAYLLLSDFVNADQGPQWFASLQIIDDESIVSFTTADYSVNENTISGNATIGVRRTGGTNTTVTVDFSTSNGTALDGFDYFATNGTLVFLPGQTFKNFNVAIIDDAFIEGNESLSLHLSGQSGGTALGISDANLVVVDNDFGPGQFLFSTNSFVVDEFGGSALVTVLRTNGSSGIVSVRLQTSDGTATAGQDYTGTNLVLTFGDGETFRTVAIRIQDDAVLEPLEQFNLALSQPSVGTSILLGNATVSILDDEFAPSYVGFATNQFYVTELDGFASVTVTRTNSRRGALSVDFSMDNGSASGADYVATNGTLFFADNEAFKTITIPVVNDGLFESAETVNLHLGNVSGGFLGLSNATLTIVDSPLPVQFSAAVYTVSENVGTAVITVTRVGPNTGPLSVDYRTLPGGTAVGGLDYVPVNGTLTWPAGDLSSRTFSVPIIDNAVLNPPKSATLTLSNAAGTATAVLTITDDEAQNPIAGPVDPNFNGNFGANGSVRTVSYDEQQRLYVGGDFSQFHGLFVNRITRLTTNGAVDLAFNVGAGANGTVYSIAAGTNDVYVAGAFTRINGITRNRIARLLPDGSVDPLFAANAAADAAVRAVARSGAQVIIGGDFVNYAGNSAVRVARLNSDGSFDGGFNVGLGPNARVRAVAVQTNGQVIIAGDFTSVNGFIINRIARLNTDGSVDTTFAVGAGADGIVSSVSVGLDGKIVIGGEFVTVNGVPRNRIARLNANGSVDTTFNVGTGADAPVRAVLVELNGHVLAAGAFTTFDSNPLRGVVRLNANGSLDSTFVTGAGADGQVNALSAVPRAVLPAQLTMTFNPLAPDSNAYSFYAENFIQIRGLTGGSFLAVTNPPFATYMTGAQLNPAMPQEISVVGGYSFSLQSIYFANVTNPIIVTSSSGGQAFVSASGVFTFDASFAGVAWVRIEASDTPIIDNITAAAGFDAFATPFFAIGGDFEKFDNVQRGGVAVLTTSGTAYRPFDPRNISTRTVYATDIFTNEIQPSLVGKIVVGGDFTALVGVDGVNRLARLNIDGTLDTSFQSGLGADAPVRAVAAQPDGKVIFGGFFTSYDLIARAYLARVNADGTLDNSFNFGAGLNNAVLALAIQPDGRTIIGGTFTEVYGTPRNSIARVNVNGTIDVTFNPGSGANGAVRAVALQSDGKVLIGGDFTAVNNVSRFHIARLNADGSVDTSFNPGAGANGTVNAIALTSSGDILVGGAFTTMNGIAAPRLALLSSNGALNGTFNVGSGPNDVVTSLRVQPDGRIVVGGNFTFLNGQVRNRIARLNGNGSLDATINFGTGANDVVNTITLQPFDAKIVIGGTFTEVDGETRVAIARLFGGTNTGSGTFRFSAPAFTVNENAGSALITVVRDGGASGSASVNFSTANGTATSPADFTAVSGTLTFADAEAVKYIVVPINNDNTTNGDRAFTVSLSNPTGGANIGAPSTATVTIADNDSAISFSAAAYSVNENGGVARITVVRTGGATDVATVDFATGTGGTATPFADFTPVGGRLTFGPGVRIQTFDVPVTDDALNEFNETVPLTLLNASGASLGLSSATLTIVENDFSPGSITFGTNQYFVSEDAGFIAIEVLRTNGFAGTVTVGYQTLNSGGLTAATPNIDYASTNGILTFADGQTNAFLIIRILDDAVPEGDETIPVQLFGPSSGATLGLANATVTIADNDAPGAFVFSSPTYTVSESNAFATITVLRTNGNVGAATVTVQTSGGSATPTLDYGPVSNVLAFADGQTVRTFTIPILEDAIVEGTETVGLLLSNPTGGTSVGTPNAPGVAQLSIVDDEISVGFAAANYTVTESLTNVTITVIRTGDTNNSFSVTANTSDGSAVAPADYISTTATLFFPPGVVTQAFTVAVIGDTLPEGNEFLNLTLSSASGGVAIGPIATARLNILDDDTGYNFSAATYSVTEPDFGNVNVTITVFRTGFVNATSTVDYATFDGTATGGTFFGFDYLSATGTLAFAVGQTSATFTVTILGDTLVENNETINLALFNASSNTFLGPQSTAVITILDNDTSVGFAQTSYIVNERATNAFVTLVRSGAVGQPVSVTFSTANGTAFAPADYTAISTTVSWAANDVTPKTVVIPIVADAIAEGSETVNLQLSNPVNATIDPFTGASVLNIVDNAGLIAFSSVSYSVVEGSGNAVMNLVRTGGSNGTVAVQWTVTGGSATPDQDYFGTSGTVVFASGETSKPIIFPIGDDPLVEGVETVNLTLTTVDGGGEVGSPRNAVLSIIDNDAGVIVGAGTALIAESFVPTNNIIEPGETVTILFALRNAGVVNADNVTAFLVASNGVTNVSPQVQNYGALIAGGNSVSRPFTFTALGTNGSRITATLMITNNGLFLGTVAFDFVLGAQNIPFQNANQITINDNTNATPYPATLTVSGVSGPVNHLSVTLHGLTHSFPDDIDMLLVGPNGRAVMLMSDAGGGLANAITNVTITFDDAAANVIPDSGMISNGTYRAANHFTQVDPIPPFPVNTVWSNTSLSVFNGTSPNGVWSLYIVDDATGQSGLIANGWSLNIATSDPVIPGVDLGVTATDAPDPVTVGNAVSYTITVVNYGPSAASSVMVTNILPIEANFISVAGPGTYTLNGNVLVGNLGSIPMGGGAVATVTMTAPNAPGLLTFDSVVGAGQADLNPGNNFASIKTSVNAPAPLPTLFTARKNGSLILSWQGTDTNVVLQSATLLNSGAWSKMTAAPTVTNGYSTVTVPMGGGGKFFRLGRQ